MDTGAVAVPKKKSSEKRKFNTLVRMDDELCEKARMLATHRKTSMAEMFSEMLRPVVDREYSKMVRKLKEDEAS